MKPANISLLLSIVHQLTTQAFGLCRFVLLIALQKTPKHTGRYVPGVRFLKQS